MATRNWIALRTKIRKIEVGQVDFDYINEVKEKLGQKYMTQLLNIAYIADNFGDETQETSVFYIAQDSEAMKAIGNHTTVGRAISKAKEIGVLTEVCSYQINEMAKTYRCNNKRVKDIEGYLTLTLKKAEEESIKVCSILEALDKDGKMFKFVKGEEEHKTRKANFQLSRNEKHIAYKGKEALDIDINKLNDEAYVDRLLDKVYKAYPLTKEALDLVEQNNAYIHDSMLKLKHRPKVYYNKEGKVLNVAGRTTSKFSTLKSEEKHAGQYTELAYLKMAYPDKEFRNYDISSSIIRLTALANGKGTLPDTDLYELLYGEQFRSKNERTEVKEVITRMYMYGNCGKWNGFKRQVEHDKGSFITEGKLRAMHTRALLLTGSSLGLMYNTFESVYMGYLIREIYKKHPTAIIGYKYDGFWYDKTVTEQDIEEAKEKAIEQVNAWFK